MHLLYQAMARLSITPFVFVAIPRPKRIDKNFKTAQKILKKLELGLITVAIDSPIQHAEILLFPGELAKSGKANKKAAALRKEINNRTGDTAGGSTGVIINTAYRERCIKIACLLEQTDALSPRELVKNHHCDKDTGHILRQNHYRWFTRIARGLYALSAEGKQFLNENADNPLVVHYRLISSKIVF